MARRIGEPQALAAALEGRHAALLHAEHAHERRRVAEETLALAGELGASELAALERHWLLYDLDRAGRARARRPAGTRSSSGWPPGSSSRSTVIPRSRGAACGAGSRGASTRPSGSPATPCGSPRTRATPTPACTTPRSWSPCGASRAGSASSCADIEALAGAEPDAVAWRSILPLAHLDAGDRTAARTAYDRALAGGTAAIPRNMYWLAATASLAEAAAELGDAARRRARCTPSSSPTRTGSSSGASAATPARCSGCSARTAAVAGRPDAARAHFEAALARHAALDAAAAPRPHALRLRRIPARRVARRRGARPEPPARRGSRRAPARHGRRRRRARGNTGRACAGAHPATRASRS